MNYCVSFPSGYDELHPSVFNLIFNKLPTKDLLNCSQVCTAWYNFFRNRHFWIKRLISSNFISVLPLQYLLEQDNDNKVDNGDAFYNEDKVLTCLRTACIYQPYFHERKCEREELLSKYTSTEKWELSDNDVQRAASILLFRSPTKLRMSFNTDIQNIDYFEILLIVASKTPCQLFILDKFSWKKGYTYSDTLYEKIIKYSCQVIGFQGRLSPSALTCGTLVGLEHLLLGFDNGTDLGLLNNILPCTLRSFGLHISANCTISNPLPHIQLPISVYISGLQDGDTHWLVQTLLNLASSDGLGYLYFPNCEMSWNGINRSIVAMADAVIIIYQFHISLNNKSNEDLEEIGILIRHKLKCSYFMYKTDEEMESATNG